MKNTEYVMNGSARLGKYRHFKGNEYELIHIAKDSEYPSRYIAVYRSVTDGTVWTRPLDMFLETVTVGDRSVPRFEYIGE